MLKSLVKDVGFSKTIKGPKRLAKELKFESVIRSQFSYPPIVWMDVLLKADQ